MALRAFKTARAVLEATRGAGGTPTRILPFSDGTLEETVATIRPEELRSSYFGFYNAAASIESNELTLSGDLDYSQAAWLGQVFVKGGVAGTGASADKTYTYLPTGTADDLKTACVEFGYGDGIGASNPAWKLTYVGGEELTLSFSKPDGRVTYDATFRSASTATQIAAFTGTPTSPTTTLVSPNVVAVYSDPGGTIGATADNNVLDVEWTLGNGWQPLYTLNNSASAQAVYRPGIRTWTARIRRYYANDTWLDDFVDKTVQKIRVRAVGATLGTSNYSINLDLYGVFTGRTLTEVDGLGVEEFTLEPVYDSTATTDFQLVVVCADTSIT